ncbi:MAG: BlaI/MecI/CopY family transcriptional regulator [Planctomycetota bacterium]|nr:BlaI/MecI/CopY family transcriptional regulator [Planctomycetota bacterium]MCB9901385.1 BlaI/MecI/CopY family transcriptional regulator [Planctomycetota bacterium]
MDEPHLTDAEWKVMDVVWDRGPVAVRDVHGALEASTRWAYTTVKTLLDRLVDKGVVEASAEGRRWLYVAVLRRDDAQRGELEALRAKAFGGRLGGMLHLLLGEGRLGARDREALRKLVERVEAADDDEPRGGTS